MKRSGSAVLDTLVIADTITDCRIRGVEIGDEDDKTYVRIKLDGRRGSQFATILLTFREIIEYGFYDSEVWGGHEVVHHKFFETGGDFYISLDPFDPSKAEPEEQDNYFVQAKFVEAELMLR